MGKKQNSTFCHTTQDAHRSTPFIKNNQIRFANPSVTESLNSLETLRVALLKYAPNKTEFPPTRRDQLG